MGDRKVEFLKLGGFSNSKFSNVINSSETSKTSLNYLRKVTDEDEIAYTLFLSMVNGFGRSVSTFNLAFCKTLNIPYKYYFHVTPSTTLYLKEQEIIDTFLQYFKISVEQLEGVNEWIECDMTGVRHLADTVNGHPSPKMQAVGIAITALGLALVAMSVLSVFPAEYLALGLAAISPILTLSLGHGGVGVIAVGFCLK